MLVIVTKPIWEWQGAANSYDHQKNRKLDVGLVLLLVIK